MDYVLLHGTAQSAAGWDRLVAALEDRGHRAFVIDFPVDQPDLLAADYARIAVSQVPAAVREPVVLAHSGAGLLLPAVANSIGAGRLGWIAAVVPDFDGGTSFTDQITAASAEIAHDEWREFGRLSTDDPVFAAYFAFHDCDLQTLRWGLSTMRLFFPEAVYAESPPARPPMPSMFVLPQQDRTLRPSWLRRIARERLGVEPIEIPGGHFPHVSRPHALADILTRPAP
jgi:pimeloyl-ACP methyl ester carboxylesterase